MADLGELSLLAAIPLSFLSALSAIYGAWTTRRDLAEMGGRAASATAVLLLIAAAGLGHALIEVQLRYAYVVGFSDFGVDWTWRLGEAVVAQQTDVVSAIPQAGRKKRSTKMQQSQR